MYTHNMQQFPSRANPSLGAERPCRRASYLGRASAERGMPVPTAMANTVAAERLASVGVGPAATHGGRHDRRPGHGHQVDVMRACLLLRSHDWLARPRAQRASRARDRLVDILLQYGLAKAEHIELVISAQLRKSADTRPGSADKEGQGG